MLSAALALPAQLPEEERSHDLKLRAIGHEFSQQEINAYIEYVKKNGGPGKKMKKRDSGIQPKRKLLKFLKKP